MELLNDRLRKLNLQVNATCRPYSCCTLAIIPVALHRWTVSTATWRQSATPARRARTLGSSWSARTR